MAMTDAPVGFEIQTAEEATAALEFFNALHDGFMKRIVITSRDEMTDDPGQTCSGVFDVEIDFAHYNYRAHGVPLQPHTRIIRASFEGVQDVSLDLNQGFIGNSISFIEVAAGQRVRGGTTSQEPCLELRLGRQYFIEAERRWEPHEARLFSFTRAVVRET
jgi:hypothetical protein